jgi:hypothetical protein
MKIGVVSPKFVQNQVAQNRTSQNSKYVTQPRTNTLQADTISFKGSGTKIFDVIEHQFIAASPRMQRIATTFLDVLQSITTELASLGFSMDREYCEAHVLKSVESSMSKIRRSGSFRITDPLRASIMNKNINDLSILANDFIPALNKRGYVFAPIEMPIKELMKRGYIPTVQEIEIMENLKNGVYTTDKARFEAEQLLHKKIPDLDIRMKGATKLADSLPEELRYSVGEPPKDFIYDIQGKLIRGFAREKRPVYHELIILPGPETQRVKTLESASIYSHIRRFTELHTDLSSEKVETNEYQAQTYISLIKGLMNGKISAKLFSNAKNKDLGIPATPIDIIIGDKDIADLQSYFKCLFDCFEQIYAEKSKAIFSGSVQRQLTKEFNADTKTIEEIRSELTKTLEYFKRQTDLGNNG